MYDDAKTHEGRAYSGMRVGGSHDWDYPDGRWQETKVAPDRWDVRFESLKRRRRAAPEDSGAAPGTMYHWLVLGHQRVRKLDADTYATLLEGVKWKIAHRRPHWRAWSSEYPEQPSARRKTIEVLEAALTELRAEEAARAAPLEATLSPVPFGPVAFRSALDYVGASGVAASASARRASRAHHQASAPPVANMTRL